MKKIPFHDLIEFNRLHEVLHAQFGKELCYGDAETRISTKARAITWLRESGFPVDDKCEWVIWPNMSDYLFTVLKWT